MTSRLPDEILLTLFEHLDYPELLNCQQVCRHWYSLAHLKFLKEVKLITDKSIEQFIATFDRETSQSYFNAVNTIRICRKDDQYYSTILEKEAFERLFFRFPNLQNVYLDELNLVKNFDEDLCKVFLSRCPKLNILDILDDEIGENYGRIWEKVRPLITHIRLCSHAVDSGLRDPVQFITHCPRLRSIFCEDEAVNAFARFLPIFEQPTNITKLHFAFKDDIDENFETTYFTTKPKEIQDLIRNNFSNITNLYFLGLSNAINAMNFVSKYCTGLKNFGVNRYFMNGELEEEQDLFSKTALNAVFATKGDWDVEFHEMPFTSLSNNFACLVQNMFYSVSQAHKRSNHRVLNLRLDKAYPHQQYPHASLFFQSTQAPFSRNVEIQVDDWTYFNDLVAMLNSASAINEVDVFKLKCFDRLDFSVNAKIYLDLLATMSSLKEVQFEIPRDFKETIQQSYDGPILCQVEQATFKNDGCVSFQSLLDSCSQAFPNLKQLHIFNFSGLRRANVDEFLLDLPYYSLERLTLDVMPVVLAARPKTSNFFVLEVEILDSDEQCYYLLSHDFTYFKKIKLEDLSSIGFKRRNYYTRVRLIVTYLKQIVLLVSINGKTEGRLITLA